MAVVVGLGLVELGVVASRSAIDAPVDIADGVTRRVLTVVGELGAKAFERAAMAADAQALDRLARNHLEIV